MLLHTCSRWRAGAERRQRMRLRLIESALPVFAEKGLDAASIDDVIAAAGVSRGTFYNYFRTDVELAAAVSDDSEIQGEVRLFCGECHKELREYHEHFLDMLF